MPIGAVRRQYHDMLNPDARAELLVHAVDLTLNDLAPDCLSHAILGAGWSWTESAEAVARQQIPRMRLDGPGRIRTCKIDS